MDPHVDYETLPMMENAQEGRVEAIAAGNGRIPVIEQRLGTIEAGVKEIKELVLESNQRAEASRMTLALVVRDQAQCEQEMIRISDVLRAKADAKDLEEMRKQIRNPLGLFVGGGVTVAALVQALPLLFNAIKGGP